jgi:hypothetical protein
MEHGGESVFYDTRTGHGYAYSHKELQGSKQIRVFRKMSLAELFFSSISFVYIDKQPQLSFNGTSSGHPPKLCVVSCSIALYFFVPKLAMSTKPKLVLWPYTPSLAGGIIASIIFFILCGVHAFRLVRNRTWFCIPFVIGALVRLESQIPLHLI